MPSPIMPVGVRAVIFVNTPRRLTQNVLYYTCPVVPTHIKHMQKIADTIDTHFRTAYRNAISNACTFRGVMAYYSAPTADVSWQAWSSGGEQAGMYASGTNNADMMPDEDVAVIRKVTGKSGREDRGRIFISGMPEAGNVNGRLEATYANTLVALAVKIPQSLQVNVVEGDDQPVYEGQLHARHWNRKDNVLRPIVSCMLSSVVMQQRRRRRPLLGLPVAVPVTEE